MKAYTNDYDTFIAESLEDLLKVIEEHYGCPQDAEELEDNPWEELWPTAELEIGTEEDEFSLDQLPEGATTRNKNGYVIVKATVKAWIEKNGRGFLCSTEY